MENDGKYQLEDGRAQMAGFVRGTGVCVTECGAGARDLHSEF
mgnify:CR=1 FL=1